MSHAQPIHLNKKATFMTDHPCHTRADSGALSGRFHILFALVCLLACAGLSLNAQDIPCGLVSPAARSSMISGFGKTVSGETIDYHSAMESARKALIVRATHESKPIEWVTGAVTGIAEGNELSFVWLAALSGSKGVYPFVLSVNGERWFTFLTEKDSARKVWTVKGKGGASLTFCATGADRFQDLFGYMVLNVPASRVRKGDSLRIRVSGEAAASNAWYMTFQYPLEEQIRISSLPALVAAQDTVCQVLKVMFEHFGPPRRVSVSVDPRNSRAARLGWGATTVFLPVKAVREPREVEVVVAEGREVLKKERLTIRPVHRRELYLLPHSHTDIGYSAYQVEVQKNHIAYVDQAMEIANNTRAFPPEARFKWNLEVAWELESYLAQASRAQKERLIEAIKEGSVGVNALYTNELTGLCRPEEILRLTEYARSFSRRYDLPLSSAMITDIPAYSWSTVTALGLAGVKYLSSGPNYMPLLPDGGDRVGHALKTWGDRPFYWESRSGQSKVLFWMAGRGYSMFHGWIMGKMSTANPGPIFDYVAELESVRYPYSIVQLRYTIDGDNGPPDPDLSAFVRDWNAKYLSPKMVISTTDRMFEEFERRHGKDIPVMKGDLTPYWEDGAVSSAREEAVNLGTGEDLVQLETLYGLFNPSAYRPDEFYAAWRNVILWHEHTWGASNSISEPDSPAVLAQWAYKQAFALEGRNAANRLFEPFSLRLPGPEQQGAELDIVNTHSWPRTDIVILPKELARAGSRVKDGMGRPVPSQPLSTGELAVVAKDVPPMGSLRLILEPGMPHPVTGPLVADEQSLSNAEIQLRVDAGKGTIRSFRLRSTGQELVDTTRGSGWNEYLYMRGKDPKLAARDTLAGIRVRERGPLVVSFLITSRAPGCRALTRELRLFNALDRIDIIDAVDKERVREKESVHFGFPFRVPDGVVRTNVGWETVRAETDQLAGSCKDFLSVQRWVDISNREFGVTWATIDAPLVEVGALIDETPNEAGFRVWRKTIPPAQNIYSYVMNNYWHTNYKADQEGSAVFRYSIHPHGRYDPASAYRFGVERSQPLLVVRAGSVDHRSLPSFTIQPASIVATALKPAEDGKGWILRLHNTAERAEQVSLLWSDNDAPTSSASNLFEDRKEALQFPVTMPANGILTIRLNEKGNP